MGGILKKRLSYRQTIEYLYEHLPMYQRIGKAAYKADLSNTLALDEYFGHPHLQFNTIHIAGTNGKGSVSHILASIFQEAGRKTGLYTSPHMKDFRERIKINGEPVPKDYVVEFFAEHKETFDAIKPSFFEMTVALAYEYFADQEVDIAIVETGLGGRLDSTNIITPIVSVITNIGTDHSEFLGNSPEEVAAEKAGIIKPKIPVVIGERQKETAGIFDLKAEEFESLIVFASDNYTCTSSAGKQKKRQVFQVKNKIGAGYKNLQTDLRGEYQKKNAVTALQTLEVLKRHNLEISREEIYRGFKNVVKNTGLLGRWQILGQNPKIICDSVHNTEGMKEVINQLRNCAGDHLHMVLGFTDDEKVDNILKLLPNNATYYFTHASLPRAMKADKLMKKAHIAGLKGSAYKTPHEALNQAKKQASPSDIIFVGGSTYVVAEII